MIDVPERSLDPPEHIMYCEICGRECTEDWVWDFFDIVCPECFEEIAREENEK